MRVSSTLLALIAIGGVASAQPGPPPQPPPPPMDTATTPTATTDPAPPDQGPPPPPQPPVQQAVIEPAPVDESRPVGVSIALGFGYGLPTSLEIPNRTSVRLRLASGLTFEPVVTISSTSSTMDPPIGDSTTDKITAFGIDTLIRLPVIAHKKVDLEAIGSVGLFNQKRNPDGDYNATTDTSLHLGYGVGIAYWLTQHWNLSMTVTNPLIDYSQSKNQGGGPNLEQKTSTTTVGIVFLPSVFAMIHLYN